jgi:hypothetical protein
MIDLVIIVSPLHLVLKIEIGDSSNCVDQAIGWKVAAMLRMLLLLCSWRWQCVWLDFSLMVLCTSYGIQMCS